MKLRTKNRNYSTILANGMFYWISILVSLTSFMAFLLHVLGKLSSEWNAQVGLAACAAVSWTVYVLHKRYVIADLHSNHISAFLGMSLLLFLCLYNPHQFTGIWFIFLLYPIFLSFFLDRLLLVVWGAISYFIFTFSLGYENEETITLNIFFSLIMAGGSALCAWAGHLTMKKVAGESRLSAEAYNREAAITLLNTLVPIVERKTQTSSKEIEQMSRLMKRMLLEFPQEQVQDWEIKLLSLLHYVSRIKFPDYVFETREKLTTFEFQIIQEHCMFGLEMFRDDPAFTRVVLALQDHHEKYDGSGYPNKLKGDEIRLLAQILGIVECFLAMTAPRAYRETVSLEEAFEEICGMAGTAYDEKVVRAFTRAIQIHSPTRVSNVPPMVG
ncbi:HD-GYP domain-containing protein [Brevibacillus porteri]|uniref:HD-GYP domain-containing protein n=1 Tax=Brevibacillus porteri TaxID=2126350 RepID=UPI00370A7ABE